MQVAVIGVGYMGKRHALQFQSIPGVEVSALVDSNADRVRSMADELGCSAFTNLAQMLKSTHKLDAVSVAVPTTRHTEVAETLVRRRIPTLIEKPLAPTVREARYIAKLASSAGTLVQVGHIERFNPAVRAVQRLGVKPLIIKSDRVGQISFRSMDIDVVFDIMIHDIDLALLFTGATIHDTRVKGRGFGLSSPLEDVANAALTFHTGCTAELTASRIALTRKREMRIFTRDSYISIDFNSRRANLIEREGYLEGLKVVRQLLENGEEVTEDLFRKLVRVRELVPPEERGINPLDLELRSFVEAVSRGDSPEVGVTDGLSAVIIADRIRNSLRERSGPSRHRTQYPVD